MPSSIQPCKFLHNQPPLFVTRMPGKLLIVPLFMKYVALAMVIKTTHAAVMTVVRSMFDLRVATCMRGASMSEREERKRRNRKQIC